jgi:porin
MRRFLAWGVALALTSTSVFAQQTSAAGEGRAQPDRPLEEPQAAPDAQAAPDDQAPLLQGISAPFKSLYKAGVLISSDFYDDLQGNPVGGLKQGSANAGAGTLGLDADTQGISLSGGRFHLLFTYEYGDTLQHDIGNFIKSQDWYLPFQKTQLALFAYEQSLFDGKLNLYGGRVSAATMFAKPTFGCDFISGSQCPYALPVFTGGFSGFPYATWGGRVRINPTPKTYIQSGVFSVDPVRKDSGGFSLGLNTTTGVAVPVELGYESDFDNDRYPRHYKLGGWYNNAPSLDPLLNSMHQSLALFGGAPLSNTFGRGGLYSLADQVIYRPDGSHRNLAVFGSVAAPLDDREIFTAQNTVGVMVTQVLFTSAETQFMNQLLAKNGSTSFVQKDQFDIEVHYGYRITPGVVVTPNVEYILHPDTTQRPDATFAPKNALVLGVRLTMKLTDALGLPAALPKLR